MSKLKNKINPNFSEGVDRKLLKQVRDRFLQVNADRLGKTQQGLSPRHQDILLVLPLLYQVNHPLMPGYVSRTTPVGVSGYEPDKATLSIAKSFSQTFKFKKDKRSQAQVQAIFMMGSTGTLAHSEVSDVDLWLCHDPGLSSLQLQELAEKASKIDEWANALGLELHTFLMNAEQFRDAGTTAAMDKESSGSAQHYLLLDEFYRTAILLAGRYPVWWLIPPALESDYKLHVENLLSKRFIKDSEVLDFGTASDIPKSELIGAGLWQLYKGLDSPYKSVLKILLAEVYSQELPQKSSLSQSFKQAVYDDDLSVEDLDPYLLIYRRLENYLLEKKEHKRLDIVRKSFYLKVAKKLSRSPSGRSASWQRKALERVVRNWGWPDEKFRYLDRRSGWKVDEVSQERQALVAELSYCYRFLSQYARMQNIRSSITSADLNLLGRKLYAIYQKKAGKVERVNPGIALNLWEENLAIHHVSSQAMQVDQHGWLLYRNLSTASDASFQPSLKKSATLIELLAWLYFNGILTQATRLSLVPGESDLRIFEVQSLIRAIEQTLPMPLPAVPQENFKAPAYIKRIMLFINVGVDPMKDMAEKGMHRISDRTDSLDYSTERSNLVKTIDQLAINSWNEVMAYRFEMGETLMQNLQSYLQVCQSQLDGPECQIDISCFCPQRAEAIARRVEDLFSLCKQSFFKDKQIQPVRYVIEIEERYYILQYIDDQFRYSAYASNVELYQALSQRQRHFSPVTFDDRAQQHETLLAAVLPYNQANTIQVFYFLGLQHYQVVVLDEMGSLLRFILPVTQETLFQSSVSQCIQRMLESRQLSDSMTGQTSDIKYRLYKLSKQNKGEYKVKRVIDIPHLAVHEVQVLGSVGALGITLDLSLSGMDFNWDVYGEQQFQALIHYAHKQPSFNARLPFMVSELMLASDEMSLGVSTVHRNLTIDCLRMYAKAEQELQRALENL